MDDDNLDEFHLNEAELTQLDQVVENLPKIEQNGSTSTVTRCNNGIPLKRGRTSSFEGLTDEELSALDVVLTSASTISPNKRAHLNESSTLQDDFDDFGGFTSTQLFNLMDQAANGLTSQQAQEQQGQQHSAETENDRQSNRNTITASQQELAAAVFDDDESEPSLDHLECLRRRFKHNEFRGMQWEIIRAVMIEKRDVCAVMATGYGKSLCFQVNILDRISFKFMLKMESIISVSFDK